MNVRYDGWNGELLVPKYKIMHGVFPHLILMSKKTIKSVKIVKVFNVLGLKAQQRRPICASVLLSMLSAVHIFKKNSFICLKEDTFKVETLKYSF